MLPTMYFDFLQELQHLNILDLNNSIEALALSLNFVELITMSVFLSLRFIQPLHF